MAFASDSWQLTPQLDSLIHSRRSQATDHVVSCYDLCLAHNTSVIPVQYVYITKPDTVAATGNDRAIMNFD